MANVRFTLTVPNGGTASNTLSDSQLKNLERIVIYSPGTQPEAATIQVSPTDGAVAVAGDWKNLQVPLGAAYGNVVPTAGNALAIDASGFRGLRIGIAAVAAERVFELIGEEVESY